MKITKRSEPQSTDFFAKMKKDILYRPSYLRHRSMKTIQHRPICIKGDRSNDVLKDRATSPTVYHATFHVMMIHKMETIPLEVGQATITRVLQ